VNRRQAWFCLDLGIEKVLDDLVLHKMLPKNNPTSFAFMDSLPSERSGGTKEELQ
jgi:hypothetical protein